MIVGRPELWLLIEYFFVPSLHKLGWRLSSIVESTIEGCVYHSRTFLLEAILVNLRYSLTLFDSVLVLRERRVC